MRVDNLGLIGVDNEDIDDVVVTDQQRESEKLILDQHLSICGNLLASTCNLVK